AGAGRGQRDVEDDVAEEEQRPPEREAMEGHPALLAQVADPARRWAERISQRLLSRNAVRVGSARLVAHALAAARLRPSTRRMIRIAVSPPESAVTSSTGHRSFLCSFAASSSSP